LGFRGFVERDRFWGVVGFVGESESNSVFCLSWFLWERGKSASFVANGVVVGCCGNRSVLGGE
jgi:hypothetical protein